MDKQKSYWIDALKALGILLVVIGHSGAPWVLGKLIYGFHMPLFFVISGYLFNEEKWLNFGFLKFFRNRWKSYIKLYFIWTTINLFLNFPIELYDNGGMFQETICSSFRHISWIIISYGGYKEYPNCTPLWFLPCLFVSSLFLYGLVWIEKKKGMKFALIISLLLLLSNYYFGLYRKMIVPWHIDVAMGSSVIMFVGYKIKQLSCLLKRIPTMTIFFIILVGVVAIMVNDKIDMNMNTLGIHPLFYVGAVTVPFFLMYIFFNSRGLDYNNVIINRIGGGRNTITILALNYFFNTIYRRTIGCVIPDCIDWIVDVCFVMIVSYLVIFIMKIIKIRQAKYEL